MDFFEIIDRIKYYAGRYFWAGLFLVLGIALLIFALTPGTELLNNGKEIPVRQNSTFLFASFFFIGASIIWILYLMGAIKTMLSYLLIAVTAVSSAILIFVDYHSVQSAVEFKAEVDIRDVNIRARLNDIKQAEIAYKETNGTYTDSMDDLINFVKTGKKMRITKVGTEPERKLHPEERDYLYNDNRATDKLMTEREAALLAISPICPPDLKDYKRDTNYVSVLESVFLAEDRQAARAKSGATIDFHADSLRYVPFSKNLVRVDTGSVNNDDIVVPTLYIQMSHPMNKELKRDSLVYTIGDTLSNSLRESWGK